MACVTNRSKLLLVEPSQGVAQGSTVAVLESKLISQIGYHTPWAYSSLGYPLDKPTTHNPA